MPVAVRGLEQLRRNVDALKQHVELRAALRATEAGAKVFQAGIELRAPRDTGQLSAGVVIVISLEPRGYVAKIGPSRREFYAQFLEFGTVHRVAHPFMRPTLDEDSDHARRTMDIVFRQSIETMTRSLKV